MRNLTGIAFLIAENETGARLTRNRISGDVPVADGVVSVQEERFHYYEKNVHNRSSMPLEKYLLNAMVEIIFQWHSRPVFIDSYLQIKKRLSNLFACSR